MACNGVQGKAMIIKSNMNVIYGTNIRTNSSIAYFHEATSWRVTSMNNTQRMQNVPIYRLLADEQ